MSARITTRSALVLLCSAGLLSSPAVSRAQLVNGGFENGFGAGGVGLGWELFSTPGYSPSAADETVNVYEGQHAQRIILPQPSGEGYGGIMQTFDTVPGRLYRIDIRLYAHMPYETYAGEDLQVHLGFDAQGRSVYDHGLVDFDMSWIGLGSDRDTWKSLGREFQAAGNQATLFLRGWRKFPQHGPGYIIIDEVTVATVTQSHPSSHASLPPPTPPPRVGANLLVNPDFEEGFTEGVGDGWSQWVTRGTGSFKPSSDLGKIGGGHYNPEEPQHVSQFLSLSETAKVAFAMPPALNQLTTIKQRDPEVLTVARHIEDDFNFWDKDDAGTIAEARAHAERCYAKHLEKPGIDAWQGFNEPWVQSRERARKAGLFAWAFAERCHELGIRSVILNLGVGNPLQPWHAEFFKDALAVTDFVGYHAYGGSSDMWQTGPQQDAFALRWRDIKSYYEQMGWRHPAVVYTEAGTYFGWKAIGGATPELCRDKYIEFGPYMQADDWVVGETIFTVGGYGLWDQWDIADDPVIIDGIRPWNQAHSADARGGKAQQFQHDGSDFRGGIVQVVATNPGDYWLNGWFKYETGPGGDPVEPDTRFRIGYDPSGQQDNGDAAGIVWSGDQIGSRYLNAYVWYEFGLPVSAGGGQTSIWFVLDQPTSNPTGRVYVDALELRTVEGTPPPEPRIELDPTSMTVFSARGTDAADASFTVRNAGTGALAYSISDDADWLEATPQSGTSGGEADIITITFNTSGLSVGPHHATTTVSDANATNDPQLLDLTLIVTVPADFDNDGDVDQEDFGRFQTCYSGAGIVQQAPECLVTRLDGDLDVDQDDFAVFQACVSGANMPAEPTCGQ